MQHTFVGREAELERLRGFWGEALAGKARVCFVTGEAGAGKSTLIHAFARAAQAAEPRTVLAVGSCDAQTGQSDAYLPFLTMIAQLTGDVEAQGAKAVGTPENTSRLRALVGVSVKTLLEHAPDLVGTFIPGAALLVKVGTYAAGEAGLTAKLESRLAEAKAAAAVEQDRIFRQYTDLLTALSAHCPLILVLDDLQWADGASIDLFFHLARALDRQRILLVGTYRPNDVALGRGGGRHPLEPAANELKRYLGDVWIDLDREGDDARRAFVSALVDAAPNRLGADFREALFRHTGGHPLFAVELLRTLQERGDLAPDAEGRWTAPRRVEWDVLPTRVEGVIGERIGRLTAELREILTVAAVEGQSFTTQIVARLQEMRERELLKLISGELDKRHRLVVEGATERVGAAWVSQFAFSHALFQQYLYNDLSGRQRMLLHGEVAALLEELYAGHADRVALQLARHYDLAGEPEKAVGHYLGAAARALSVSAYAEAEDLLERARALLEDVPPGAERSRAELEVLTRLANVYNALRGWNAPATIGLYRRSRVLCEELGERWLLSRILFGLWTDHVAKLELREALETAKEYFAVADALADHGAVLQAHTTMGSTLFYLGVPADAYDYSEAALRLFSPTIAGDHLALFGLDARILPLMYMSFSAWLLGRVSEAAELTAEAMRVAAEVGHPFTLANALTVATFNAQGRADVAGVERWAAEVHELSVRHGFTFYRGQAAMVMGWAAALRGDGTAPRQVREGYAEMAQGGTRGFYSLGRAHEVAALLAVGEPAEALAVVEEALEVTEAAGDGSYEPDLHRMRGEALAALGRREEAEAALLHAVKRARWRLMAMPEMRAVVSLGRFWLGSEQGPRAAEMIDDVLGRITAPDGLPELEGARRLAAELRASAPALAVA